MRTEQTEDPETTKTCKKCGKKKPLSEYYKHPDMGDGHLNQCKNCKREYERERHHEKMQDPEWREKERERTRKKYHRLNYGEKYSWENLSEEQRQRQIKQTREYRRRNREKQAAHNFVNKHMEVPESKEAHHWSYKRKHRGSVILLNNDQHNEVHRHLEYDSKEKLHRNAETGELLNSRAKHLDLIRQVIGIDPETREKTPVGSS